MAKKSRTKHRQQAEPRAEGEVGPRQPCPCGSGRRYKNCHGSADGARGVRRAAVRGPALGVRPGGPARAGARGHRAADRRGHRPRRSPVHAAADGRAGDGARQRRGVAGAPGAAPVRRPVARPGRGADQRAGAWPSERRARHRRPHRPARPRSAAPGPRHQRPPRRDRARRVRLLGRRRRRRPGDRGRARAGQRRGLAVGPADHRRGGVLDRRRHQGAPALGDARSPRPSCSTPWRACTPPGATSSPTSPGWSGCSAPTGCSCRSGTCRSAPAPRRSRSRPSGSPPTSPRRWPTARR